ncbi:acyl-CoA dehydrogenase, partial [Acinetobacter ursingii]
DVLDQLLQLLGGYGYMLTYPISRSFVHRCVQNNYGGTNVIINYIKTRNLSGQSF